MQPVRAGIMGLEYRIEPQTAARMTCAPDHAQRRYSGDFIAWPGGAIFIGEGSSEISPHAHYAEAVGMPPDLRMPRICRVPAA